ncbi:uncharacterized protein LOC120293935 [Eucalyptus grandis]|uniref:uncharacterized protein LOC120293935 n=1 Tax=Eucalyptus grandis TaxID=71139 RepID=UPI00192E88C6|nr:uncharacterized protein LOC120293935 [Eucalyptus grandis]
MAEAIVSRVADILDDFARDGKLGVLSVLAKIVSDLRKVVPDAEKRSLESRAIEAWLEDVKAAFYDAEDLLEGWNLEITRPRESPSKDKKSKQASPFLSPSFRPTGRLEVIRRRMENITSRGRALGLEGCPKDVRGKSGSRKRLRSDPFVEERDGAKRIAAKGAINVDPRERAKDVQDERGPRNEKRSDFFVHEEEIIGREDAKSVIMEFLLDSAAEERMPILAIWGMDDFMSPTKSYSLEALPERLSLDLLMRMAYKDEEKTRDPEKLLIGRQIVKECRGIPLLVRTIGSSLFFKKTKAKWLNFKCEILELSAESQNDRVCTYLKLCYCHLPSHLKQCFAFCSLFPRDWIIDKLMLMSLWIAEGFIRPIDNVDQDMEDIAHDYFMDLVRRNFFQDCTKDELGNVTSCKMHDFLNKLACAVAQTECSRYIGSGWPLIDERTHHLSVDSTLDLSQGPPATVLRAKHQGTFIKMDQTKSLRCETLLVKETL